MSITLARESTAMVEPSEEVFPAERGEFYAYSARFTEHQPLYVFLKCKSQKSRALNFAADFGKECNLVFQFGNTLLVSSIRRAHASGILGGAIDPDSFGETWLSVAGITAAAFDDICSSKDASALVAICKQTCVDRMTTLELQPNTVYAAMSDAGKYCIFLVKELMPTSIEIEACHILI